MKNNFFIAVSTVHKYKPKKNVKIRIAEEGFSQALVLSCEEEAIMEMLSSTDVAAGLVEKIASAGMSVLEKTQAQK